jgi:xanthine/CO dehydrogenase XdhC/CoxF family maturation factor
MRSIVHLQNFWRGRQGEALALCTIIRKEHSGYRAAGAKKIVAREGASCGLLSGGCLEGDIDRVARENWDAMPFIHSFSSMAESDRLLGYQTGCAGRLHILFERLPEEAPCRELYLPYGAHPEAAGVAVSLSGGTLGARRFATSNERANDNIFFDPWIEPIALHIVGCGIDAHPFAELAPPLRFLDYRSDAALPDACAPHRMETYAPAEIARVIPERPHSAVVLMTHNYEADMTILAALSGKKLGYVGCLGPRRRYEQMKQDLAALRNVTLDEAWEKRVHAPAGLFTSGREPECIALSIVAQIQSLLRADDRR